MLVMIVIFVSSFFELTWSLRLYNFACVIMGSVPLTSEVEHKLQDSTGFSQASGFIMTLAAKHFNFGLRACSQ